MACDRRIDFHVHYLPGAVGEEEVLRNMDAAGIEVAVVLAVPDTDRYRMLNLTGTNEEVAKLVEAHPDRFVGGVYVDPRSVTEAQATVKRYRNKGFPIVKVWPAHGFSPDDEVIYPVWQTVNDLKMGVLLHMGASLGTRYGRLPHEVIRGAGFNARYGQPVYLDQPARFFPDAQFIMAHSAYPWTLEALVMARMHHNVHVDFSASPGFDGYNLVNVIAPEGIPWEKFLYASDSAGRPRAQERMPWCDLETWVQLAESSPLREHRDAFFFDNARALLERIGWPGGR